jgi:tRNA pseudouridine32 synthase/23S rRNA pseudouridine746 synthase
MPVHPSRNDPTPSVEDHFGELGRFRAGPWLAHRLDRDTAGCLVVALRRTALHQAQACFAEGRAQKTYWAAVRGVPSEAAGEMRGLIGRIEQAGTWRMAPAADGALAVTRWRVLGTARGGSWLELTPLTGRTHQIRLHCAMLGCPILGDGVYGPDWGERLHLLARAIRLPLDPVVEAEAGVPEHMREAYQGLCPWTPPGGSLPLDPDT